MNRLFALLAFATVAALAIGCGTVSGRLGKDPTPVGIDQDVVTSLVCEGRPSDARVYVVERGGTDADVYERLERAKLAITEGRAKGNPRYQTCCQGDQCPATH